VQEGLRLYADLYTQQLKQLSTYDVRNDMGDVEKVSVHGGHSGQFCCHAENLLEEIVEEYIKQGFSWIGITEHTPAISDQLLYPDQKAAGLTADILLQQFEEYMKECHRLRKKYVSYITICPAMEIETYSGYESFVPYLINKFSPSYLVGSVHFVNDIGFDYSEEYYEDAVSVAGGIDILYENYFDLQYDMINRLRPAVIGHFDLIRLFDPDYHTRLKKPTIAARVTRNLELIRKYGLIIDYNLRALYKGASEPYVTSSILKAARELNIAVVPGDDSHGRSSVGNYYEEGVRNLQTHGCSTEWQLPSCYHVAA